MKLHSDALQPQQVCYFYLPAHSSKPAEIIAILNCNDDSIRIPMPEEDVELRAFLKRSITTTEQQEFGSAATWRIYTTWGQLEEEHQKYNVPAPVLMSLLDFRGSYTLQGYVAVA